ncbi:MAG: phosphorylase kinase [Planctomycetaceae bacterium]|nr:phosphorylase kinase [Planctomycetaceae bacterium]
MLQNLLHEAGTFEFPALSNGLFPAALALQDDTSYTGYSNCWVRDNVLVSHGLYATGNRAAAAGCLQSLAAFFLKYRHRFDQIIADGDQGDPMLRPHIRFHGESLAEIDQQWAHAQNDALGYFLWLFSRAVREEAFVPTPDHLELMQLIVKALHALKFWEDEDSGHWEEVRKVSASSVGTATAGLLEFSRLYDARPDLFPASETSCEAIDLLEDAITRGRVALKAILPAECVQNDRRKFRRYDAALIFLIEPLQMVERATADEILADVSMHLQGDYGIRRYIGDSYWCADYKDKLDPEQRTNDFSENQDARDALLDEGQEAQWCIFDPIISVIHGKRFEASRDAADYQHQIHYFHRALRQLTPETSRYGGLKCPESYYMEKGKYVPNDITPLLWTQANLLLALHQMKLSVQLLHS